MSGGMIKVNVSGKADVVMSVKGDIVTYSTERVRKAVGNNSQILVCDSSETDGNKYDDNTTSFVIACSDETSDLTTGDDKAQIRLPFQFELTSISLCPALPIKKESNDFSKPSLPISKLGIWDIKGRDNSF